jgi:hypothetical protein
LKFLKNRILSEEFANGCWDVEFSEVWEEDFEWYGWLFRHSLRRYRLLIWTIELRTNSIRSFGHIPWFCHRQLRMQQSSISFRIVWYRIHSLEFLRFWVSGCFSLRWNSRISCFSWVIS